MRRAFNNLVSVGYSAIRIQEKISIGEGTELGPSVYIYDHDYRSGFCSNCNEELLKKSPIEIGKNCWIGANTLILRGTKLGDNCVVGGWGVCYQVFIQTIQLLCRRDKTTYEHINYSLKEGIA